jgi:hypothetical protein
VLDGPLFAAVAALGLAAGAVLAEAAVLVPFWRSQSPEAFLLWYRQYGGLLLRFFGPLEGVAAAITLVAAGVAWGEGSPAASLLGVAALLALLVLAAFPLYFRDVNASFADATIELTRVPEELRRWSQWHAARVLLATLAFLAATAAALRP